MPTDMTKAPTSSTIGPMIDHVVVPLIELPVMMSSPWRVHRRPMSTMTTPATTHNGLAMGQLNHACPERGGDLAYESVTSTSTLPTAPPSTASWAAAVCTSEK